MKTEGQSSASPEQLLAEAERPKADSFEVRDLSAFGRLATTPALHRLMPAAVAVPLARLWAWSRWWLSASERATSVRWAAEALDAPPGSRAVRRLARRGATEAVAKHHFTLRPWMADRAPIEGLEHLESARAGGRGAILVLSHLGHYYVLAAVLRRVGVRVYAVVGAKIGRGVVLQGFEGRMFAVNHSRLEAGESRMVPKGGSYAAVRALLARGDTCQLMFDVPGGMETRYLGRTELLTAGVVTLARDAGVALVPTFVLRRGSRWVMRILEPVEPSGFDSLEALQQGLADVIGPATETDLPQLYPHRIRTPTLRERLASAEHVNELLSALPSRERPLWELALRGGLAPDELQALEVRDVDIERGVLRVERRWRVKDGVGSPKALPETRELPLPAGVARPGKPGDLVFGRSGRPFDLERVEKRAADAWRRAGLAPIRLSQARHASGAEPPEERAHQPGETSSVPTS